MNIVSKRVLAGAAVIVAYACANPVDISGDVLLSDPSDFGDAGVFAGAGGASAGSGADVGGSAGETAQGGADGSGTPAGGTGGSNGGVAGTGGGTGGTAQVGLGGSPGIGGAGGGTGGSVAGGAGGTSNAQGGTANAGTGGTTATAGTGGGAAQPVFDANACDFEDLTGCEDLACAQACPPNSGTYCQTTCEALLNCITTDPACTVSEADPLCAARDNQGGVSACTAEADSGGGANSTNVTSPAFIARQLVECLCSTPRP
jgi:hypothetical protein